MHEITDDDIRVYNISMNGFSAEDKLGDMYPYYICGNSYRKLKDSEGNWIKSITTVFDELIIYLMDAGYEDSWIFLFMSGSAIGKELVNGDCEWQKHTEDWQIKKIDFHRLLQKQRAKEIQKKAFAELPDYMLDDIDNQNPKPDLPHDHPLRDPYVLVNVDKELGLRIVHEKRNRLVIFLCAISAFLCEKPLGAAGLGPSSVGKNMVFDTVLKHIPEKISGERSNAKGGWFRCNNLKEAALFRLDPEFINHTIVYLGETPDKPTETHLELMGYLRQLQSEGIISKTLSEQVVGDNGLSNWSAKTMRLKAEVSFFAFSIFGFEEQFGNRQIPLSFDESEEQTNRIGKWKAEMEKYGTERYDVSVRKTKSEYIEKVIAGIDKVWYEQYKEIAFHNPYAIHVEYVLQRLYSGSIQYRRVINYVFRFIETITRLHAFNRTVEYTRFGKQPYQVVATSEDNLIALYLLWPSLQQAIQHVTREDIDIYEKMEEVLFQERNRKIGDIIKNIKLVKNAEWEAGEQWFSSNAMAKALSKGKDSMRKSCKRLFKAGYLNSKSGNKNGSWFKYSISENTKLATSIDPVAILPFFLPADSPVCLLSDATSETYSMIGMFFPLLFSLFGSTKVLIGTHYLRVQCIYYYLVYGTLEKISDEIKEILAEDFPEKNTQKEGIYHTLKTQVASKRSMEGMAKLIAEYKAATRSLPVAKKQSSRKLSNLLTPKGDNIEMLIEDALLELQKGDLDHNGMEVEEIIKQMAKIGWNGPEQEVRDKLSFLLQKGDIHQPKGSAYRLLQA